MDWNNDNTIKFLELLSSERCIWDPLNNEHKLKHKVYDAWARISQCMNNTSIEELKHKKKSLMATFRPLLKKKKASIRSGAAADDVFHPIWFAYDLMESFLGTIYDVGQTFNTEDQSYDTENVPPSSHTGNMPTPSPSHTGEASEILTQSKTNIRKRKCSQNLNIVIDEAQKKIDDTINILNTVITKEEDECDLYAKLLAKKLRKYPAGMREAIMYKIDGLLMDNPYPMQQPYSYFPSQSPHSSYQTQPSSAPVYLFPQSQSSVQIHIPEINDPPHQNIIERAYLSTFTEESHNMSTTEDIDTQDIDTHAI